jgi:hypothetical protein
VVSAVAGDVKITVDSDTHGNKVNGKHCYLYKETLSISITLLTATYVGQQYYDIVLLRSHGNPFNNEHM